MIELIFHIGNECIFRKDIDIVADATRNEVAPFLPTIAIMRHNINFTIKRANHATTMYHVIIDGFALPVLIIQ